MTLHEAIIQALLQRTTPMTFKEVASSIAAAGTYLRNDGNPPPVNQLRARVRRYPQYFTIEQGKLSLATVGAQTARSTSCAAVVPPATTLERIQSDN